MRQNAQQVNDAETRTALVVDDSIFSRQVTRRSLESCGFKTVVEANDGEEAVAYLAAADNSVGVIICDLDMPMLDGIQFIRTLAKFDQPAPIVLLSGAPERTLRAAESLAVSGGLHVAGVLAKPVKHEQLRLFLSQLPPPKPKEKAPKIAISQSEVARGIKGREIELYYQPKVDLKTRAFIGMEALVRWNHPEHGLLLPDAFVPIAEEADLAGPLTDVVIAKAVAQCAKWRRNGLRGKIAINLSPRMITNVGLPDHLTDIVAGADITPSDLMFEVTESGMFKDDLVSMEILARLDLKGYAISIDDFGTGYSSMQQLQRLPFAELKIDRMFVTDASRNVVNQTVIRSSVDLARKLAMSVTVEGVESADDWSLAYGLGCDAAQGYFIAKPMPAEAMLGWTANWRARTDIPALVPGFRNS